MSKQTERDTFRSRWGFILACIGSAVGMGNIWRFPYLVSAWGGMTFLLPYFLFVLLIGSTGIIGEMALGRSTRSGPIGAFGQAAALRGRRSTGESVGYIPVLGSLALAIGYSCVVGWIFRYFALALDGGLFAMGQNMNVIVDSFNGTACGWGNNFWLVIALAVNFAIMAFGVGGGIERANKVMMPVLFFLFAGLGVYIATLPGAGDGYRYIFTLDPVGLADPKLWIYAFGQAFFSLSVAGNGTVIYGSYFSDDESIPIRRAQCGAVRYAGGAAGGARHHSRDGGGRRGPFRRRPGTDVHFPCERVQRDARRARDRTGVLPLRALRGPHLACEPLRGLGRGAAG